MKKLIKNEDQESDDYLIELIGIKADFPEEALAAYGTLYDRYWDSMLLIAEKVTKDTDRAMDLVSDTFNMVYKRASSFKKGKIIQQDNLRLAVLNWMTAIMRNVFYDNYLDAAYKDSKLKEQEEESPHIIKNVFKAQHFDSYEDEFIDLLEKQEEQEINPSLTYEIDDFEEDPHKSQNLLKIQEYLSKISDRDQDIILTIYNYYVPGKNTPTSILDELENKWGTSRENIRKILQKFRQAITQNLQDQLNLRK